MSTLRVTGLKQETSTATNISLAVGGGVTVAGVSTFYSNVDLGSNSLEGSLQVGTGATISGFTNAIDFLTDGTHRVRLDPSGRLMLGTTTEGYENYADNFTIADSAHCGLTLRSGTTSQGNIYFSDGSSNGSEEYEGIIQYLHSNDAMAFGVNNGQERMRIDSSGNVGINTSSPTSDGGTTLEIYNATTPTLRLNDGGEYKALFQLRGNDLEIRGSNGQLEFYTGNADGASSTERVRITNNGTIRLIDSPGIDFSQIQTNASDMTSETLDSYEEGTWTPTLPNGGTVSTINNASYTKVGRLVTANLYVQLSSIPNNTSIFQIGGLPFANGIANHYGGGNITYTASFDASVWRPIVTQLSNTIYFHRLDGDNDRAENTNFTGISQCLLQVAYFSAS